MLENLDALGRGRLRTLAGFISRLDEVLLLKKEGSQFENIRGSLENIERYLKTVEDSSKIIEH